MRLLLLCTFKLVANGVSKLLKSPTYLNVSYLNPRRKLAIVYRLKNQQFLKCVILSQKMPIANVQIKIYQFNHVSKSKTVFQCKIMK